MAALRSLKPPADEHEDPSVAMDLLDKALEFIQGGIDALKRN